ncbi:MAG: sigma-70 family RNA polymerase sigma factor [Anaerolineae bacterium]|nr:sigma-70 family RNA polymerase sigma factor [Anaerolineae bacterium]
MTEDPERHLIERAPRDPDAFRSLYRAYFPRVYAYVAYRVGRAWDAEDVTTEVFIRVLRGLPQFEYRGQGAFAAWVFRIAYTEVCGFFRQQRDETTRFDELPDIRSDEPSPDQMLLLRERFARLRAHIAELSPRRQEIVTLRSFGGLRNQEIATILGLDERTVASHLSRALADLQRSYENELDKDNQP